MKGNFTKEDIKNSVEYGWRKSSLCWMLGIWAAIEVVMLFVLLFTYMDDTEYVGLGIEVWLIVTAIYSAILLPFVAFYGYKMFYLLKHYTEFDAYEVMLDNVSTSYAYKGAVYYTVTVTHGGVSRNVCTNPYFSSSIFAKYALEDYNNQKVVGLYDSQLDKFYIIQKAG